MMVNNIIEKQIEELVGEEFTTENYNIIRYKLEDLMDEQASIVIEDRGSLKTIKSEQLESYYTYLINRINLFLDIKNTF